MMRLVAAAFALTLALPVLAGPSSPYVLDVGVDSILRPRGTVDSGSAHVPLAIVRNNGDEQAVFSVSLLVGNNYASTRTETLPAGLPNTIQFLEWEADEVGTLDVVCYAVMDGDENPANDTGRTTVVVLPPAVVDVGVLSIEAPMGTVDSGSSHIPRAVVSNFGDEQLNFPTTMEIGQDYRDIVRRTLSPGETDTLQFAPWSADLLGSFPLTCFCEAAGDVNPQNDTARDTVFVSQEPFHDVGAAAILSPGLSLQSGDTVAPRVLVRNYGNRTERYFDVRFRIQPVYDHTVTVQSIEPNSAIEVTFPVWTAAAGTYAVACSTMLYPDDNPGNDTLSVTVRVTRTLDLFIERDQSGFIGVGETREFDFYAELRGDYGDTVEIPEVVVPTGWNAELYDSTGRGLLQDSDGDGIRDLGFVEPDVRCGFTVLISAQEALQGDTALPVHYELPVHGFASGEPLASDSALLTLTLVPRLQIHNFPNPLEDRTRFVIGLPDAGEVRLGVYDRTGKLLSTVLDGRELGIGVHVFDWSATTDTGVLLAPGTYIYMLGYENENGTDHVVGKLVISRD